MSDSFIGEIIAVGYYYDGNGFDNAWLPCDGRLVPVAQFSPLFSLIGTTYGGDGRTTFGLPNLNGRIAISQGRGPGLTDRSLGEMLGHNAVTLTAAQMPRHNHEMQLGQAGASGATPGPEAPGTAAAINPVFNGFVAGTADTSFSANAIANDGGSQAHANTQPTNGLWYLICHTGIYPSFS